MFRHSHKMASIIQPAAACLFVGWIMNNSPMRLLAKTDDGEMFISMIGADAARAIAAEYAGRVETGRGYMAVDLSRPKQQALPAGERYCYRANYGAGPKVQLKQVSPDGCFYRWQEDRPFKESRPVSVYGRDGAVERLRHFVRRSL